MTDYSQIIARVYDKTGLDCTVSEIYQSQGEMRVLCCGPYEMSSHVKSLAEQHQLPITLVFTDQISAAALLLEQSMSEKQPFNLYVYHPCTGRAREQQEIVGRTGRKCEILEAMVLRYGVSVSYAPETVEDSVRKFEEAFLERVRPKPTPTSEPVKGNSP